MNGESLRVFTIEGKRYRFDTSVFNKTFREFAKSRSIKLCDLEKLLSEKFCVSESAIRAWRFGQNGPSDLDLIESVAAFFKVPTMSLLKSPEGGNMSKQLTDRQLEALRRIYVAIVDYIDEFERSNGFNDLWFELADEGVDAENIESKLYEIADNRHHKVLLAAEREGFDLKGLKIYEELLDFISEDLVDIYDDGKLAYGYRFEAPVENIDGSLNGVPHNTDVMKVHKRLDEIMGH